MSVYDKDKINQRKIKSKKSETRKGDRNQKEENCKIWPGKEMKVRK